MRALHRLIAALPVVGRAILDATAPPDDGSVGGACVRWLKFDQFSRGRIASSRSHVDGGSAIPVFSAPPSPLENSTDRPEL